MSFLCVTFFNPKRPYKNWNFHVKCYQINETELWKRVFKTDFMLRISEIKLGSIVVHTADWEVKLIIFERNISLLFVILFVS